MVENTITTHVEVPVSQCVPSCGVSNLRMKITDLNVHFGKNHVLKDVSIDIMCNSITAIIGPSGCGKSTFIRCLNRMNDIIPCARISGTISLDDKNIYDPCMEPYDLRKKIGMVFQKPNPFPKSIYENLAFGLKIHGLHNKTEIENRVVRAIKDAALWEEVKDRLHDSAFSLSGGQQQRLCIARCLAIEPEVILFDEPCSALDPISTAHIEELAIKLKEKYTIAIVTHNLQQAARISDYTGFLFLGKLVEFGETKQLFTNPKEKLTEKYITGRFG
ncbi:phosphate ABC transporter ATP-binding protein [candidate division WOR-3 bacterium]|nr:phosphate ABC transporter ATP-binding protein [candidate division WOR-3 bacterium]